MIKTIVLGFIFSVGAWAQMTVCLTNDAGTVIRQNAQAKPQCLMLTAEDVDSLDQFRAKTGTTDSQGVFTATYGSRWRLIAALLMGKVDEIKAANPPSVTATLKTQFEAAKAAYEASLKTTGVDNDK